MSYSRRQLYALGEPIGDSATYKEGGRTIYGDGGGGGGGSQPQQTTAYNTNIPEYAKPYVETMLGAAQKQIFTGGDAASGFTPYTPYSTNPADYVAGFSPMQQQAFQTAANLQVPNQYAAAGNIVSQAAGQGLGAGQAATGLQGTALGYGQAGAQYGGVGQQYGAAGAQQANLAAQQAARQAQMYGRQGALTGGQALGYGAMGAGYGAGAAGMAGMGYGAGAQYAQQATSPEATQAYMSPYMQNVVDYQKQQAARDYQIASQVRKAQAVGAGAFGGSRQAIQEAEAQRSLMSQLQGIQATGTQQAFQQAQQAQQFGANLGLQGLQAGTAAQQAGIQGAGLGLQGVQGAQAGYGLGLQGVGQQLAAGQLGLAGTAQGIQGAQAGMQGAQTGLQGVQGAIAAGQYGLSGAQAATQAAQTLGQLGTSELGAQTQIAGLQQQYGAQQQALEQQKINQAIQNYATAQQYPYMQLGILSNLLRGLPMQSTTTSSYQATPSTAQQVAGLGLSGLGAYKALSGFKEGGTVKGLAGGGSSVENSMRAKLESMTPQQLDQVRKTSSSAELRAMAAEVLAEHQLRDRAEQQARQAIAREQAAKPQMPQEAPAGLAAAPAPNMDDMGMAGGGIVAFADGGMEEEEDPYAGLSAADRKLVERQAILNRAMGVKDNAFADYKTQLGEQKKGLGQLKDYTMGMGMMDLGARIASTPGPWGSAIAESITGALPGFQKGVAEYNRQKADLVKADYEVAREEQKEAQGRANKLTESIDKRDELANRLKQTEMQVQGNITAAGIGANRETDLDRTTAAILAAKIANGAPDNAATRAAARTEALAATGFTGQKVATQQEQAVTTALDKDEGLKSLNGQLGLLQMKRNPSEADKVKMADLQDKIVQREALIRSRVLRQPQAAAPSAAPGVGGNVVDFNALPRGNS